MNGIKFNNMKKGQILLITVMILATVLKVVLSVSFKSITETQVTKLEEENEKTLAAAEAAIEAALNSQTGTATLGAGSLSGFSNFTGSADVVSVSSNKFTSPILAKDTSYTFYLSEYDPEDNSFSGGSLGEDIEVCFKSATTNPAIEITLVKTGGIFKYPVDPNKGDSGRMSSTVNSASSICSGNSSYNYSFIVPGAQIGLSARFLVVRVLYQGTRLHFSRTSTLPQQGKTVSSSAVSSAGVSKKITLFQTYPQIPAEFFNTSF